MQTRQEWPFSIFATNMSMDKILTRLAVYKIIKSWDFQPCSKYLLSPFRGHVQFSLNTTLHHRSIFLTRISILQIHTVSSIPIELCFSSCRVFSCQTILGCAIPRYRTLSLPKHSLKKREGPGESILARRTIYNMKKESRRPSIPQLQLREKTKINLLCLLHKFVAYWDLSTLEETTLVTLYDPSAS